MKAATGGAGMVAALRAQLAGALAESAKWQRQCGHWKGGSGIRKYKEALERSAATRVDMGYRLEAALKACDEVRAEREQLALRVAELESDVRLRSVVASFIAETGVRS